MGRTHDGDQDLSCVMTDTKTEMAQSITGSEVMVCRESAGIDIFFQRCDQIVETRVDNRAAIEVDDPM